MEQSVSSPKHVAIIMDGNGRWAEERGVQRVIGHKEGIEAVDRVVAAAKELGIQYLTLFAFSIENWGRPKVEVNALMKYLSVYLEKKRSMFHKEGIVFNTIGRISMLPGQVQQKIASLKDETKEYTKLTLTLALSYSGQTDIIDAVKKISDDVSSGAIRSCDVDEQVIRAALSTNGIPNPDLLIRTSGETRISNFLLWELAYTELYFIEKNWPDFGKDDLVNAIAEFRTRKRRFGKV